eukprot:CAMPEP_0113938808 /NCGR_PEP_ID=MMETSP1339-20121228/5234_1 /TAXON_ID=94617 /ORGANISM="Fibrocapsa japonica" /LENGTH=83 /DNA_ID=CAMNT_0000942095 /DNA_START=120 /DNA_END=367 /DNA_ORIENTATION=- /assembly_acc=CAM_ASM_000762
MSKKLYVGNLDPRATEHDLQDLFSKYGNIRDIWIARRPPGFAFVTYDDERDAEDAIRDAHGREILGQRIRVESSRSDGRRGGG